MMSHHGGMAGGMNKRGGYGSMADRVARSQGAGEAQPALPTIKHCWVTDRHGRLPSGRDWWRREGEEPIAAGR